MNILRSTKMDFSGSTEDPHTFAKPEQARVTDIHLELIVDFKQKVLKGKAILTIKKKSSISGIFLDNYGLIISRVTNIDGTDLDYHVGIHHIFGSSFYVELPPTVDTTCNSNNECKIEIEYKTSSDSPALYWLTSAQTANGTHPFLLSNNKLIYARAWFPCQDTPSVKFTYTAKILVPKHFTVLMSALLQAVDRVGPELEVHEFRQIDPVPSYAVIIAVGSLQIRYLNEKSNMFIEKKFIDEPPDTFLINTGINTIERMLEIAKSLCGPYPWERYDICVLPPNVAHLKIECPRVIFISPTLLGGDLTSISSLARNISQSWAGNYVTCSNYEHLWLNKSFSIFISRKIKSKLLMQIKDIKSFLERKEQNDLNNMIQGMEHPHMLKCLLPNLTCLLPHKATEYVPYETGCMLLDHLEEILGGSSVFELFLKSYFHEFAFKSINTQDWINYLYQYFSDEKEILGNITWNAWFHDIPLSPTVREMTAWETKYFKLTEDWVKWNCKSHTKPDSLRDKKFDFNVEKIIFLNYLHDFHENLTEQKLALILYRYRFENHNAEIRFLWLLLCIKVRWEHKVNSALMFAIQYCSPNYACPIFQHLYEWEKMRKRAINTYIRCKKKILDKTQNKLDSILHLPL